MLPLLIQKVENLKAIVIVMDFNLFQNSAGYKLEDLKAICKHLPGVFKGFQKASQDLKIIFAISVKSNELRQSDEEELWEEITEELQQMKSCLSDYESEITERQKKNETITSKINIYDELKNLSDDKRIKKDKELDEKVEKIKQNYETTFNEDSKFKSKFDERVKNIKIKVTKKTDPLYSDSITEHLLRDLQEINDEF